MVIGTAGGALALAIVLAIAGYLGLLLVGHIARNYVRPVLRHERIALSNGDLLAGGVLGFLVLITVLLWASTGDALRPLAYLVAFVAMGRLIVRVVVEPDRRSTRDVAVGALGLLLVGLVVGYPAMSSGSAGSPAPGQGWQEFSRAGIHWSMPANPRIEETASGWSYGHNAIHSNGTPDPCATFNVNVSKPLAEPPSAEAMASGMRERAVQNGWTLEHEYPMTDGRVGYEADYAGGLAGCDVTMHVRMVLYGNVLVVALHAGDVGKAGSYFLDSFTSDSL
jgi:hypothetical protein